MNLSSIRVTEVMYDPAPATAAEIAAGYTVSDTTNPNKDFQFIEIENTGTQTLPLGGLQISGGVDLHLPPVRRQCQHQPPAHAAPNSYVVAVADLSAFTIRYGADLQAQFGSNWQNLIVAGQFSDHHLSNSSDEVELSSPNGGVVQDFTYQSSWYPQTHGGGFSLTVRSSTQATDALELQRRLGAQRGPRRHAGHGGNDGHPLARRRGHQRSLGQPDDGRRRHDRTVQHHHAAGQRRRLVSQQ